MRGRRDKGRAYRGLAPETRALVWELREQGRSLRAIEAETGISAGHVHRVLHQDPVRNEALEARLRARQATEYEEMGSLAREGAIAWLREGNEVAKGGLGKVKASTLGKLAVLPRLIQACANTARAATTSGALLQGRATERVEQTAQDLSRDPDALIEAAIDCGIVDRLPPALRAEAERRAAARENPRGNLGPEASKCSPRFAPQPRSPARNSTSECGRPR